VLERLNKFLYLPPRGVLIINTIFFGVVFVFAIIGYFSETINKAVLPLANTDDSLWLATSILVLGLLGVSALIFSRTLKFFLCARQCLSATLGTTVIVAVLYAAIWSFIRLAEGKQQFVLFHPGMWNLQATVNNVKYGSVLLLFVSSVSLLGSWALSLQPGHDFTPLIAAWKKWKGPVEKLAKSTRLTSVEHEALIESTEGMLAALNTIAAPVQPVSSAAAEELRDPLLNFQDWYTKKTHVSFLDCHGLESDVATDARRILRLC
jgi:hypothetical protein